MSSRLKRQLLTLLDKDLEFRYTVAGYIGISEILKRLDRHEEELVKLREDMNKLREDMNKLREDMNKLREDMIEGFNLLRRHIDALGARWGIISEQAFREGLKGIIEKELGLRVEKWVKWDHEGYVYGYPSTVDVDVALSNEKIILIEVKSHVGRADVHTFKRKADLYERIEEKKPSRLVVVTPHADEEALQAAKQLQIEIYTKI